MLHIDVVYDALEQHGSQISEQQIFCLREKDHVFIVFADGTYHHADYIASQWKQKYNNMQSYQLVQQEISSFAFATQGFAAIIWYGKQSDEMLVVQVNQPCCVLYRQYERFGAVFEPNASQQLWYYGWHAKPQDIVAMFVHPLIYRQIGLLLSFGWLREFGKDSKIRQQDQFACSRMLLADIMQRIHAVFTTLQVDAASTLVALVQCLEPVSICWMTGPPSTLDQDAKFVADFGQEKGIKIISGATTSEIAARILNRTIVAFPNQGKSDIPPISYMEGIDLVSEGAITIHKVAEFLELLYSMHSLLLKEQDQHMHDGAFLLTRLLCAKGTKIKILVGLARNPAHSEALYHRKLEDIRTCAALLEGMGKEVAITYY